MEIVVISFYVAKNFNMFKTFLILDEDWFYFVSTFNNKITIIRVIPAFEGSYTDIAIKLAYANVGHFSDGVKKFFDANHKKMFKCVELDFELPKTEDDEMGQ